MRQSDGSEILGPDDPRNLVIGIIHVSPDDDRQSVINAITTQDQEGRDQVVLVLPARNKALKNSVDFEGLHHMAGELEAALVLVVPSKSKIENLARKENFTCYSTLEELAAAEFPPLVPEGELSQPAPPMQSARQVQPIPPTLPVQAEEEQGMDQAMMFPLDIPDMPAPAAPSSTDAPADVSPSAPQAELQPASPSAPQVGSADEEKSEQGQTAQPEESLPVAVPPSIPLTPEEENETPTDPALALPAESIPADSTQPETAQPEEALPVAVPPSVPLTPEEEDEAPTDPALALPPGTAQPAGEEDEMPTAPSDPSLAVPAAADAQASTDEQARAQSSNLPAVMGSNTGGLVAANQGQNQPLPIYYEPVEPPRGRSWRGLLIAGGIILLLIVLGVFLYRPILDLFFPPTATVTILPSSQRLQHTYQLTAVLSLPDPQKNQIDARALYADSQTQERTVKATGQGHIAGQQARGELTFYNASTSPQTVPTGTLIFDARGLAVVNDQPVTLPALNTTTGLNGITTPVHTVNTGNTQNIPANDFNSTPCCNGTVYVTNTQAFTGGQDAQNFTYVQQSDIDGVTQSLNSTLAQQATLALQGQVRPNEKAVGQPRCAPQVTSDHQAGERADNVTVSVTTSCISEVYDMQAVQVLAAHNLTQDAASNPGPAYVPVGNIAVQVAQPTSAPDAHGNVLLVVNAAGTWAYQFSAAQRKHFTGLIAGKSLQDARAILLGQPGVQSVAIALTGVGVTSIPGDSSHITINIEAVTG